MDDLMAARISEHEKVCAERYLNIELQFRSSNARLRRIENILIATAGTLIVSGFGAMFALLMVVQRG